MGCRGPVRGGVSGWCVAVVCRGRVSRWCVAVGDAKAESPGCHNTPQLWQLRIGIWFQSAAKGSTKGVLFDVNVNVYVDA